MNFAHDPVDVLLSLLKRGVLLDQRALLLHEPVQKVRLRNRLLLLILAFDLPDLVFNCVAVIFESFLKFGNLPGSEVVCLLGHPFEEVLGRAILEEVDVKLAEALVDLELPRKGNFADVAHCQDQVDVLHVGGLNVLDFAHEFPS